MKRRDALKNLGLAAGFAITAPSIFSLLQSCTSAPNWMPTYFTKDEKEVVLRLVDIMLPKTESTPSATEVNVPQFIKRNRILKKLPSCFIFIKMKIFLQKFPVNLRYNKL